MTRVAPTYCYLSLSLSLSLSLPPPPLGGVVLRFRTNARISVRALHLWLRSKTIEEDVTEIDARAMVRRIKWREQASETWMGSAPLVELTVDEKGGVLLGVTIIAKDALRTWRKDTDQLTADLARRVIMQDMQRNKVLIGTVVA